MTADDFRRIALSMPGATENAHMNHPDFRIGTRIFATIGVPDETWAMVKLTPDQQEMLLHAEPGTFKPANGAWGRNGSTLVRLALIDEATAESALGMASANIK